MRCIQGMGALSYLRERCSGFFSRMEKMPLGVGFSSLPLDTVETALDGILAGEARGRWVVRVAPG